MTVATAPAPAAPAGATVSIAPLGRRFAASLLDACITTIIAVVPLALLWLVTGEGFSMDSGFLSTPAEDSTRHQLLRGLADSLAFQLSFLLYAGVLTSRRGDWNGRTIGKRAAGLRILSADGTPLPAKAAWRRAILMTVLYGACTAIGTLIDVATGDPPTATNIATFLGAALTAAALLPLLRGDLRQTLYDRWAKTIVVTDPRPSVQLTQVATAPGSGPVFEQTIVDPAAAATPSVIVTRRVTGTTRFGVIAAILLLVVSTAGGVLFADFGQVTAEGRRILAQPETKTALAGLRELEDAGQRCLDSGRAADECDDADELGVRLVLLDEFDTEHDPVGIHAGKFGAVANEANDDLDFYAFTSADRTFTTVAGGGWLDRSCIERDGDPCKDVPSW